MRLILPIAVLVLVLPRAAAAHGGVATPSDLLLVPTLDPWTIAPILLVSWLYGRGLARLWARAGTGRGVASWQAACFLAGTVSLLAALVWPLDPLGGTLFSGHMAQHMMLTVVAAPLLVLGNPAPALWWGLPRGWRTGRAPRLWPRRTWRVLTRPGPASALQAAALWAWHAPGPFQAALDNEAVHAGEHASFLLTAALFWTAVVRARADGREGPLRAAGWVLATVIQGGLLGALITWAPRTLYPRYDLTAPVWGLTGLEDQQLAGLIMWVPAGLVHLAAGLALVGLWIRETGRRSADGPRPPEGPASPSEDRVTRGVQGGKGKGRGSRKRARTFVVSRRNVPGTGSAPT